MMKLLQEIKDDLYIIRTHTTQPGWYKTLKFFILAGFLAGYSFLFGFKKTAVFLAVFLFLSFLVHMLYRIKTHKYTRSWLDFVVVDTAEGVRPKSIGVFYYLAVIFNALVSVLLSQMILE